MIFRRKLCTISRFSRICEKDLKVFEGILGKDAVLTEDIEMFTQDWTKQFKGRGSAVLSPKSTEEVSAILAHCSKQKLAVVPQAGNTGLVGGSTPVHDEIILSINHINKQFSFDSTMGILQCDAGFILQELDEKLHTFGYMMPFDLGAKGSCRIGGNIATCAGGLRLVRYGSLHAHLLGLTVVLPDEKGTILELGSAIRKDNTSFHTPHLFLGSEGMLGVITNVTMTAVPKPLSVQSAMLGLQTFTDCQKILRLAKSRLSEILSSFEFLDAQIFECLEENLQLKRVLPTETPFTILVETSGSNSEHDQEKVGRFLEECMENGWVTDGILAESAADAAKMWQVRESAPLATSRDGYVYKHDVSLPLEHFYELTEVVRRKFGGKTKRIVTWGHLGDGNSHLNITSEKFDEELYKNLYPFLYEWVVSHGGSISAEHGIGRLKLPYSNYGKSPAERKLCQNLKHLFDPHGILNPYKFLATTTE
ncbi:unnamed protein product [Caenorhabditis angaria]|uniref:D-2-hydroxyglutarate dehydrogenase, mitochondrial n=1 Tax=Caenorhabditis angaria TaxID=860376 RepID=A0A9P1MVZ3_9PELO|nr:unnamed protein product [Caenorhabditis angaria]